MSFRTLVALSLLASALLWPLSSGVAQTKSPADTTDESGFNVRVRESGSHEGRIRAKVDRAIERAERETERAMAAVEGADPPEPPEPPEPPDFDHSEGNDLVRFGEDIEIPEGRVIEGDVVAIGGSVTVLGRVKGDCVSVGGTVHIKGKGVVEGDAVSLGGGVTTSDSASVGGSDVSVGKFDFGRMGKLWPLIGAVGMMGTGAWLVELIVGLLITALVAWLSLLFFRRRLEYAASVIHERFGRSLLMGILGWFAVVLAIPVGIIALILAGVIAIVILCITIIGIPVAILLAVAMVLGVIGIVLGAVYVGFLGYLAGTMFLGRRILGDRVATRPLLAILTGALLIGVLDFLGEIIGTFSFFAFHPIGMAFGFAAALLGFIVMTAGLGTLITVRFGTGGSTGGFTYTAGGGRSQWGSSSASSSTPPQPPPPPAPGAGGPNAPPTEGSSDAP
jgi:hypothetical protein